jgi:membrane-associated tyrosine/threonine-specific cdc2-inhibitory kinase
MNIVCNYRRRTLEEVRKHQVVRKHDNCVDFVGAWEEDGYLYIQMELCRTSLECYTEVHHQITEDVLWDILLDLLLVCFNFNVQPLHTEMIMYIFNTSLILFYF